MASSTWNSRCTICRRRNSLGFARFSLGTPGAPARRPEGNGLVPNRRTQPSFCIRLLIVVSPTPCVSAIRRSDQSPSMTACLITSQSTLSRRAARASVSPSGRGLSCSMSLPMVRVPARSVSALAARKGSQARDRKSLTVYGRAPVILAGAFAYRPQLSSGLF